MSIPTDRTRAADFIAVCAAWDVASREWSRSSCDTLGSSLDQGTNHTLCCCNSVSHYAVLLLPVCPTYPSSAQWCVSIPPPPVACPANCSSAGRCDAPNGTCHCCDGTVGGNCSTRLSDTSVAEVGPALLCPGDCSGHGSCSSSGRCICTDNFANAPGPLHQHCSACEPNFYPVGVCDTYCNETHTCSGHGRCTESGHCRCDGHFQDAACTVCAPNYYGPSCKIF